MSRNFPSSGVNQPWGFLLLALTLLGLDRVTKTAVATSMPLHESRVLVEGFFNLVHTRNTGIAFSLLADSGPLINSVMIPLFSVGAVALILYLFWKSGPMAHRTRFGLTLILAGAVGNLYDRFAYGYVTDFLDFHVGSYHWPAFNVADSCITIGAGLILLETVLGGASQKRSEVQSS